MSNISKFDDFIKKNKTMAAKIYHLSFDRKKEEDYLEEIARLIKNDLKAKWCKRLVASSLIFSTLLEFNEVSETIETTFSDRIYFVLSQTPKISGEDEYRINLENGNEELNENFQEIWDNL